MKLLYKSTCYIFKFKNTVYQNYYLYCKLKTLLTLYRNHMIILKYLLAGIFGALCGSFLNVVIYRLPISLKTETPSGFNLIKPRSHCPQCKHIISWWQNIPILSFIILRGRCKNCTGKINLRYPIVEIISSAATIYILFLFGSNHVDFSAKIIFTYSLIALFFIDLENFILPDEITLGLMWSGLIVSVINNCNIITPREAILGAISGYLSLWLIEKTFKLIRGKNGMGNGDFKLFAALGAWLGFTKLPLIIFLAAFTGSVLGIILIISKKLSYNQSIPFGPFLAVFSWLVMIFM